MKVTRVAIRLTKGQDVLAFANVIFDDCFCVKDFKIVQGDHSIFVAMPDKETKVSCTNEPCHQRNSIYALYCCRCGSSLPKPNPEIKKYTSSSHPVTKEFTSYLQEAILAEYLKKRTES